MYKIKIKTSDGKILAEWESPNSKVDVEIEKEIGDDISEIIGLRGLKLLQPHLRSDCDSWFEKYKNNRKKS